MRRVVTAQLGDFRLDGSQPGAATADLVLEDKPGAGEYKGTIPVSTLVAGAPALPVEVHSRYSIVWAVLAIFLGVLAAGALYQQIGLWQRKRLLERALTEAVDEDYMAHRGYNLVPEPPGRLIQDLNIQCPLRYNDEWQSWDALDSSSNIYTAVRWARNDADLDEAQTAALTLLQDIKSWLLALTAVRGVWELTRGERSAQDDWDELKVSRDAELVLIRARRTPRDDATQFGSRCRGRTPDQVARGLCARVGASLCAA